jgi:lipoprotein-anchoring transpeptidase ErfK/SrfK
LVRDCRTAAVAAVLLIGSLVAGCAGGSASPGSGSAGAPQPEHLKVVSVTPHKLAPHSAITVTFAAPLTDTSPLPILRPAVAGAWTRTGATAVFTPTQAYPPDMTLQVKVAKRAGAQRKPVTTRRTPRGSLLRAQQILARLHYLPLKASAATPTTPAGEADAVYHPPAGKFSWRYADVPQTLKQDWNPGEAGQVMRGAVIAFQHHAHLPIDGSIGEHTWQALIKADLADKTDPRRYSFVSASLYAPQQLSVWVAGHTVLSSAVNGGVASAPTPLGTYPVYERFTSTTMSGTNPDGSHYQDPGVPWVNYFSGGSAVHGFPRSSYGSPQSVGCLELPISTAKQVFDLIDYGTLVNVTGPQIKPESSANPAPPATGSPSPSHKPAHKPAH